MFGAHQPDPGVRFRQDNDFFYLTGNESLNGVLVMDAATRRVAPVPAEAERRREIRYEGGNWLDEPDAAKKYGFASIQPLTALARVPRPPPRRSRAREQLWTRLSERD